MDDLSRNTYPFRACWQPNKDSSHRQKDYVNNNDVSKTKKNVNFEEETIHLQCQYYFRQLNARINELEERLTRQEERSVSKDYFRKIITKLVSHISKIPTYQSYMKSNAPEKHHRHEVMKEADVYQNRHHFRHYQDLHKESYHHYPYEKRNNKYSIHPVLVETPPNTIKHLHAEKDDNNNNNNDANKSNMNFWKWGEDFLKPGIDLKNKIIMILEDTLNNLKRCKDKTKEEDLKAFVDDFTRNLFKTVEQSPRSQQHECSNKRQKAKKASVNVSYVNPKVSKWPTSETSFKNDSSEEPESLLYQHRSKNRKQQHQQQQYKKLTDYYRCEFIQTIMNTKKEDRHKLWQSIWEQATLNQQTKDDKVTIQLPDNKISEFNIQLEYTLGDLEHLLIGKRT